MSNYLSLMLYKYTAPLTAYKKGFSQKNLANTGFYQILANLTGVVFLTEKMSSHRYLT